MMRSDSEVAATDNSIENASPKLKYPHSIWFIIVNECCERFTYYGMKTILVIYLTQKLLYSDDEATLIYHTFGFLVFFLAVFGAILSDSWLGKFKTILYLSLVYMLGTAMVSIGALPALSSTAIGLTLAGLMLIAIGSGGIKPCVSAFGGDQFTLPQQAVQLATFFSLFYGAINVGSLITTGLTPILRDDVHCFGQNDCYSLAFGLPSILMAVAIVVFFLGHRYYRVIPTSGNMIVLVARCIHNAAVTCWHERHFTAIKRPAHWLQYAEPKHGRQLVHDTRILLNILVLFLPLPLFWSLYDQQGSRWTFQATRMDGDIGFYTIKPDQMQVVNPVLILAFLPLFEYVIYPLMARCGIRTHLQKMTVGGLLAAAAFVLSGLVELQLEKTYPVSVRAGQSQLRLYNTLGGCDYRVRTMLPGHEEFALAAHDVYTAYVDGVEGEWGVGMQLDGSGKSNGTGCPLDVEGLVRLIDGTAQSYYVRGDEAELVNFVDDPEKSSRGESIVRVLANVRGSAERRILLRDESTTATVGYNQTVEYHERVELQSGGYTVWLDNMLIGPVHLTSGSVNVLLVSDRDTDAASAVAALVTVTERNSMSMLWSLPQIVVLTMAEVMFSVTGLAFSYSQAPVSMKSVLSSCWLLTVAFGNVIDVIVVGLKVFDSQANEFFLFAGLMVADMMVFMWLAHRYTALGVVDYTQMDMDAQLEEEKAEKAKKSLACCE